MKDRLDDKAQFLTAAAEIAKAYAGSEHGGDPDNIVELLEKAYKKIKELYEAS